MPTYTFRCDKCGKIADIFCKISESGQQDCCGQPMVRLVSAPPVHFKGSGFYTTDYGKKLRADADTPDLSKPDDSPKATEE